MLLTYQKIGLIALKTFVTKHSQKDSTFIIAGDFNCNVDKVKSGDSRDISAEYINMLKNVLDVTDIWAYCYPDEPGNTYISTAMNKFYRSRIDYIFISNTLLNNKIICKLNNPPVPDHKALMISIKPKNNRGKGYWKLNNTILRNKVYLQAITNIKETINEYNDELDVSKSLIWEMCKIRYYEFTIKYTIKAPYNRKNE